MGRTNEFTLVADGDFAGKLGYAVKVKAETLVHNTPVGTLAGAGEAIDGIVTDITAGNPQVLAVAKVGDIVFVSFENDDTYYPLVLGQLYCEKNTSQSNIDTLSLNVESHATLPISSIIGDVEYDDISQLKELKGSIQSQITQLTEKFNDLTNRIEQLENKG